MIALTTFGNKLLSDGQRLLVYTGEMTPPPVLPTPAAPAITAENDAVQTITVTQPEGLSFTEIRYLVNGTGPFTPTSFTIQLSPTTSYLPGAIEFYVAAIEGVRNESQRVANTTTLAAYVAPINTNPVAPTLTADDVANTLTVSSAYALSELQQRITDAGAIVALPTLVTQVGDVARAEGYYQVRVRADTGRNASAFARSAAFTQAPVTPPPTGDGDTYAEAGYADANYSL